ncbi:dethiobiotin synthase [Thalassoglobus sp.]|uniref:dethiobiotin synthase n=1 Tax=Thalassoglobus sp. TaxID=2795869 RepID=UPI003AA8467A
MRGLFITGTDTDVGKTFWAAAILRTLCQQGHSVGAYKPVCSGAVESSPAEPPSWSDIETLHNACTGKFPGDLICPQQFLAPLAPPVAARLENRSVDEDLLQTGLLNWNSRVDGIVIEGIGGWKSPISDSLTVEHFAKWAGFPVLVIAAQRLGAINQTLLTVEAIQRSGLKVAGVILNEASQPENNSETRNQLISNAEEIQKFAEIPFLALAEFNHEAELRCDQTLASIDWWETMSPSTTDLFPTGKRETCH